MAGEYAASDDSYVRFENVQKSYDGEILVVKDLNLDIPKGEFVTMLGPSGSGKTTCLMMLAGFEPATHGEIFLGNKPINMVPPNKRGIGMVFQNYALFPHMTVAENLAFPLQVRGMSKSDQEDRVKRVLEMVELPQMGGRRPAQLSGGQQQRIAVARALVFEPNLVLMDEFPYVKFFTGDKFVFVNLVFFCKKIDPVSYTDEFHTWPVFSEIGRITVYSCLGLYFQVG